ncbi:Bifunctional protein PncA [Balamuthia mandrillaris]
MQKARPCTYCFLLLLAFAAHCLLLASAATKPGQAKRALIIVDVQNCFTANGTLAVPNGNEVIPVINGIRKSHENRFEAVILSQDWHCSDHVSFASQHEGKKVFDAVELNYDEEGRLCKDKDTTVKGKNGYAVDCDGPPAHTLTQVLWPDHCVIGTKDADFHPHLIQKATDIIIQKGNKCHIDSYSAFFDNGEFTSTPLHNILQLRGITTIYITGLATDYCTYYTAVDAMQLGYKTFFVWDATRGIAKDTMQAAREDMLRKGVTVINAVDVENTFVEGLPLSSYEHWRKQ